MKKIFLFLFVILFLFNNKSFSDENYCSNFILLKNTKITNVKDGDTFTVLYYDLPITIRLLGVDAFETRTNNKRFTYQKTITKQTDEYILENGRNAKRYFKDNYLNKNICLIISKRYLNDNYGRYLGIILKDSNCLYNNKQEDIFQNIILNNNFGIKDYRYKKDTCEYNFIFK